jgi:integrase/recombinase XerD
MALTFVKRTGGLVVMKRSRTAIGLRDRALMETLYTTGIRHAEAQKLDLYDIDTAARRLTVRLGKGQRDRVVPLTETAAHWLARYVAAARPELAAGKLWGKGRRRGQPKLIPPTAALWLSVTGRRLSYQMIADRIRDYALQAAVKASVHTFRHSCATHLLRGGASLRHVQQLPGHRDLNTTEILRTRTKEHAGNGCRPRMIGLRNRRPPSVLSRRMKERTVQAS